MSSSQFPITGALHLKFRYPPAESGWLTRKKEKHLHFQHDSFLLLTLTLMSSHEEKEKNIQVVMNNNQDKDPVHMVLKQIFTV